jgi:predicted nucleic acid-binding protein
MIVVSDTSPLNNLVLIGEIDILPKMHNNVIIPHAVHQELQNPLTPLIVHTWAATLPEWIAVRRPSELLPLVLDLGELEAISLAEELQADVLLVDERRGREAAQVRGIKVTGTLGLLRDASKIGLLDLEEALSRLKKTNFQVSSKLIEALREENTGG